MELWIWLGGLIVTIAAVGVIFWYAGQKEGESKGPKGNHTPA
ncbi:TPA: hypothetical protein ACX3EG_003865 [Vibrio parahaemolyticus]